MGKRSARNRTNPPSSGSSATATDDVPVVGAREPCPCGSGRRYKACHGRAAAHADTLLVDRPFRGLPSEPDWVALREIVPAATAPLALLGEHADRDVLLATVLPLAFPALVRQDGRILLGLQTQGGSGDPSRDLAAALEEALTAEPGGPVLSVGLPGAGPRLQDMLADDGDLDITVHRGFDFWMAEDSELDDNAQESMDRANAAAVPTERLTSVEAAYWAHVGDRTHLRWVLPEDEDPALDALARLHAADSLGVGEGTRYIGAFRAHGLLVPVWDLPTGTEAAALEEPAVRLRSRLAEALADDAPLTAEQRRARAGLIGRQLTLR